MSTMLHRHSGTAVPELPDRPHDPFMTRRPYLAQPIRVEGSMADGRYVVRAELSGFDLEKDIEVTVGPGYLIIKAEQAGKSEGMHQSEFSDGSLAHTVPLPAEADSDNVTGRLRPRHPHGQHRPEDRGVGERSVRKVRDGDLVGQHQQSGSDLGQLALKPPRRPAEPVRVRLSLAGHPGDPAQSRRRS